MRRKRELMVSTPYVDLAVVIRADTTSLSQGEAQKVIDTITDHIMLALQHTPYSNVALSHIKVR